MELYSIEWDYKEEKYLPWSYTADFLIKGSLSHGSESEQLEKVKGLISILADKLLDAGLLKVEEIEYLLEDHPDSPFYRTEEEANK